MVGTTRSEEKIKAKNALPLDSADLPFCIRHERSKKFLRLVWEAATEGPEETGIFRVEEFLPAAWRWRRLNSFDFAATPFIRA